MVTGVSGNRTAQSPKKTPQQVKKEGKEHVKNGAKRMLKFDPFMLFLGIPVEATKGVIEMKYGQYQYLGGVGAEQQKRIDEEKKLDKKG